MELDKLKDLIAEKLKAIQGQRLTEKEIKEIITDVFPVIAADGQIYTFQYQIQEDGTVMITPVVVSGAESSIDLDELTQKSKAEQPAQTCCNDSDLVVPEKDLKDVELIQNQTNICKHKVYKEFQKRHGDIVETIIGLIVT